MSDGIDDLIAATFDQPAATGEESPSEEQVTTDDLPAPGPGDVPEFPGEEGDGAAVTAPALAQTPDLASQLAALQQHLPQQFAEVQQALAGYQQQIVQQQQTVQQLVAVFTQQQQRQQQQQADETAARERTALLTAIGDADPADAIARVVAHFEAVRAADRAEAEQQRATFAEQFRQHQQQQAAQQQEQESIGLVAQHWQRQYGLTDDEARQLLEAPDPYQMGMMAQSIAYNRQIAGLTGKLDHLTKHLAVQGRIASGVDRAGSTVGATRGPRRLEDAQNDDELIDIALFG